MKFFFKLFSWRANSITSAISHNESKKKEEETKGLWIPKVDEPLKVGLFSLLRLSVGTSFNFCK